MMSESWAINPESVGRSFSALARTILRIADSGSDGSDAAPAVAVPMISIRLHDATRLRRTMKDSLRRFMPRVARAARAEGKVQVFVSAVNSVETGDGAGVRSGCREMG